MALQRRKTRRINLLEQLEERRLFAVALPSDLALPIDGTMAFGDLNGDGQLDMAQVVLFQDPRTLVCDWRVNVYLNRGAGQPATQTATGQLRQSQQFVAMPNIPPAFYGNTPTNTADDDHVTIAIGDVNGDGKNDIVVYDIEVLAAGETLVKAPHGGILLGDGKGGFKPGGTFDTTGMSSADANWGLSLADFNGDKRNDLLAYTYTVTPPFNVSTQIVTIASTVGIALNNGAGSFRNVVSAKNPLVPLLPAAPLPAGSPAQGKYSYFRVLGAGDIDGDGKAEIACQLDTDTVNFATPTNFNPLTFSATRTIVLPGAQTATGSQSTTSSTSQTPLGNVLSPPPVTTTTPIFGSLPTPGAAATPLPAAKPAFAYLTDLNRDGLADIAVLRGSIVYAGVNRSLQVALSQRPALGWKQFTVAVPMNPLGPSGNTTMMMFVGDLNGKGIQSMCFLVPGLIDMYAILGVQPLPTA